MLLHDENKDAWDRPKRRRTLMLLDEFRSPGQIDAFANHMKLMASFGLKGMLVVQSPNDLIGDNIVSCERSDRYSRRITSSKL